MNLHAFCEKTEGPMEGCCWVIVAEVIECEDDALAVKLMLSHVLVSVAEFLLNDVSYACKRMQIYNNEMSQMASDGD